MVPPVPDVTGYHSIKDLYVRTRWPSPIAAEAGCAVMAFHGTSATEPAVGKPDLDLDFTADPLRVALPSQARLIVEYERGIRLYMTGDEFYLHGERALARIRPRAGSVEAVLRPGLLQDDGQAYADLHVFVVLSLLLLLQERSFFAIHAAALCTRADSGVLFVAKSDSGKSTLSMALVREGWQYVSDDSVLLQLRDERVVASSFRRDFGLDPDAVHLFPEIKTAYQSRVIDQEKWDVQVDELYPRGRASECIPTVLIFPEIAEQDQSELLPVRQTDAFIQLLSQSSFLSPTAAPAQASILKKLVSQTDTLRLIAGRDLKENPALIAQILARLPSLSDKNEQPGAVRAPSDSARIS